MLFRINPIDALLLFLAFCLLFVAYFHPVTAITQDLGRHFLVGKMILETGQIPKTNLFSYTYPDFPFINSHYLSEVLFFIFFQTIGLAGLLLIMTMCMLMAYGLLVSTGQRQIKNIQLIMAASVLYFPILFERTDLRPEIFSFLLTALFITILYRCRDRFTNLIYLLIPLELLWVNLHIYFPVGLFLIGLFLLDTLVTNRKRLLSKPVFVLAFVLAAAGISTFLNPNGIAGALYPFWVFENYGYTIEENQTMFLLQSLGFQRLSFPHFTITVPLLFFLLLLTIKKSRLIDWLLAIAFTAIALSAVRNFPLFFFATFLPFVHSLSLLQERLRTRIVLSKHLGIIAGILIVSMLLLQIKTIVAKKGVGGHEIVGARKGVDFFEQHRLKGPIFNNFDIGSYLLYRLYPRERVFVDGRPEGYPKEFFQNIYIPMQQDEAVFAKQDEKYHFNTIFFSHTDQTPWAAAFLRYIVNTPQWRMVYLDDTVVILVRKNEENKSLIERFGQNKEAPKVSHFDKQKQSSLLQLAHFFNTVGWMSAEIQIYQDILAIDPKNCPVLYNLSTYHTQQQHPAAEIITKQYQTHCQ
ncbi:MAG: hypothetical protein HY431_01555 [Candidatus Levybacteria bacterium]|nr:hypothetical protein [Candidatus Levybacteria bacterium]